MSSPPVYHEVQTPKKGAKEVTDIKDTLIKSPLSKSPTCDPPLPVTSTPKIDTPKRPAGSINYLDALRALPEIRSIPWMPGKELPPDKSTESPRTQTKSAFLLATRGVIREPCNHCTSGVGRFLYCITLDGWFHGACATCQMGTRGNLCSLRSDGGGDKNKQQLTDPQSTELYSPSGQFLEESTPLALEPKKAVPPRKRKRESTKSDSPRPKVTSDIPFAPPPILPSILPAMPTAYTSPYAATQGNLPNLQQSPYPAYKGQATTATYYNGPPTTNNIYKTPYVSSAVPHSAQLKSLASIRPAPFVTQSPEIQKYQPPIDDSPGRNVHIMSRPIQAVQRDDSTSLSPSEQLLGSAHSPPVRGPPLEHADIPQKLLQQQQLPQQHHLFQHPTPQINVQAKGGAVPKPESVPSILSLLPKKKQKLIHGLVKDLQDSIKRAKEQADTMQQQLDQLQAAMGMDGRLDVAN